MSEQIRFDGFTPPDHKENNEKSITCCFTGHRNISQNPFLYASVRMEIEKAYALGYRIFCAGGALGFDSVAALNVLALRENGYSDIKLHLVLPYPDQHARWNRYDQHTFEEILKRADSVEYVSEHYTQWCMHARNRRLVDLSSYCICFLNEEGKSGTAYTVDYAQKKGLHTVNLG